MTEPKVQVVARIEWATGPKTDAFLRRHGIRRIRDGELVETPAVVGTLRSLTPPDDGRTVAGR